MSKDLLKVLEKVDIDRPMVFQEKSNLLIKEMDLNKNTIESSPIKNSIL